MSSSTYSADLYPDRALRRIVLLSGIGLAALGVVVILTLPLHLAIKIVGVIGWLLLSYRELVYLRRAHARCKCLRITAGGDLWLLGSSGDWHMARILPGTVVLRRIAWIRCRTRQGCDSVELVRGNCRESHDWRRLQVIWQYVGGTG